MSRRRQQTRNSHAEIHDLTTTSPTTQPNSPVQTRARPTRSNSSRQANNRRQRSPSLFVRSNPSSPIPEEHPSRNHHSHRAWSPTDQLIYRPEPADQSFVDLVAQQDFSSPPVFSSHDAYTSPNRTENQSTLPPRLLTRTTTDLTAVSAGASETPFISQDTAATSFSDSMTHTNSLSQPTKRTRHAYSPSATHRRSSSLDDLFGSPKREHQAKGKDIDPELPTVDLTEATQVPDDLMKPIVDNRTKLAAFQCVICMDDVTTLTVTHCGMFQLCTCSQALLTFSLQGHLFCAECLHSSLHVDTTRGKCPMCRSKIDMKERNAFTSKTKGYWPLELKLMTTTRKGKRKLDEIS